MIDALHCAVDGRKAALRERNRAAPDGVLWNGIDFVEACSSGTKLFVHLLCPFAGWCPPNCWSLCCERAASAVQIKCAELDATKRVVTLTLSELLAPGTYTLHVGEPGFDPRHRSHTFTFTEDETTEIDPKPRHVCPPLDRPEPEINYLAKDYASFRQLILDRLALIMPQWQERHVPDLGVTIVELLAYAADYLSYFQDSVATEAYLDTARQRVSVRRHVRLIDYELDEGCNARAFVHVKVDRGGVVLNRDNVLFITQLPDSARKNRAVIGFTELGEELPRPYVIFEPLPLPRPCRLTEDTIIKNEAGCISWLLDVATWLHDRFDGALLASLRLFAATAACAPPPELMCHLRKALCLLLDQDCLLSALKESDDPPSGETCRRLAAISDPSLRNRCILHEAAPHLFAAPDASDEIRLDRAHNEMHFYTWDQTECCLPVGTTRATLIDELRPAAEHAYAPPPSACSEFLQRSRVPTKLGRLQPGDILFFEERIGPKTHHPEDADPAHRQAVRLAKVTFGEDPVTQRRIVEIEWHAEDALQFPLCISSRQFQTDELCCNVSVALGNVVLVDHGFTGDREMLGEVPSPPRPRGAGAIPALLRPFRPQLKESDITFAEPVEGCPSATRLLQQKPHHARPQVYVESAPPLPGRSPQTASPPGRAPGPLFHPDDLIDEHAFESLLRRLLRRSDERALSRLQELAGSHGYRFTPWIEAKTTGTAPPNEPQSLADPLKQLRKYSQWYVKPHLLDSQADHPDVVVEIDNARRATLRFGDGDLGRAAEPGETFWAKYRIGNGPAGNVGADKIAHLVYRLQPVTGIARVRNPLAAAGGRSPESLQHARLHAPDQFRSKLRRAILAGDYAEIVERDFGDRVQAARAVLEWTGSWYEVALAVDPKEGVDFDRLRGEVESRLETCRRIAHRVRVRRPIDVPLDIAMTICVRDGFLRAHVQRDLQDRFSNRRLADGSLAFFHPDRFTFGEPVYLSRLIAEARRVDGVENVDATKFHRWGGADDGELAAGVMTFGPFEIPRLDNDGRAPHNGRLCLDMRGAR